MELTKAERNLITLLRAKRYQTVTVKVQDSKIVHVKVEESIKIDEPIIPHQVTGDYIEK